MDFGTIVVRESLSLVSEVLLAENYDIIDHLILCSV